MIFEIEQYTKNESLIHRWDARFKTISLFILIIGITMIKSVYILPVMICTVIVIYLLSKLPFSLVLSRIKLPALFLVMFILLQPFIVGEKVIFHFAFINIYIEGLILSLLVTVKFFCITILCLILFATTEFSIIIDTLRIFRIPVIITDIMMFSFRYTYVILESLSKVRIALKKRGFMNRYYRKSALKNIIFNLKTIAQVSGSILIRSFDQSERVSNAMILRGYSIRNIKPGKINKFKAKPIDVFMLLSASILSVFFIISGNPGIQNLIIKYTINVVKF